MSKFDTDALVRAMVSATMPGAPSAYTLDGPPERMIAAGFFARISSVDALCGTTSE